VSVVSNSSPLIALARIERLDLIPTIIQSALIPPAVAREIAPSIPVLPHWLEVRAPTRSASVLTSRGRLGDGEWEAIALAVELGASAILIDDRPARRLAEAAAPSLGAKNTGSSCCSAGWRRPVKACLTCDGDIRRPGVELAAPQKPE
jgi:hypothetical protein